MAMKLKGWASHFHPNYLSHFSQNRCLLPSPSRAPRRSLAAPSRIYCLYMSHNLHRKNHKLFSSFQSRTAMYVVLIRAIINNVWGKPPLFYHNGEVL